MNAPFKPQAAPILRTSEPARSSIVPVRGKNFGVLHPVDWNEDNIEFARQLWLDGKSASQIAAALGCPGARNAVIGKMHRLGLSGKSRPAPSEITVRVSKRPDIREEFISLAPTMTTAELAAHFGLSQYTARVKARLYGVEPLRPWRRAACPQIEPLAKPEATIMSRFISIVELTATTCRWPLWEPDEDSRFYCGATCDADRPYCAEHMNVAHASGAPPGLVRRNGLPSRQVLEASKDREEAA